MGELGAFFNELPRRIKHGAADVSPTVIVAQIAVAACSLAILDSLGFQFLSPGVINHSHRVVIRAIVRSVDMCRQRQRIFGLEGGLRHLRLGRKIDRKKIRPAGEVDPFLREYRRGDEQAQCCRH